MRGQALFFRMLPGLAALGLACGCGSVTVKLAPGNKWTGEQAVSVIARCARLNALAAGPDAPPDEKQIWADRDGWAAVEGGRILKLYYSDIVSVSRCYAQEGDIAATACLAGLMGPFSSAYVELAMRDGMTWKIQTDPGGDPALYLNCLPLWLVTFPRPLIKTRKIGNAFELMRLKAEENP